MPTKPVLDQIPWQSTHSSQASVAAVDDGFVPPVINWLEQECLRNWQPPQQLALVLVAAEVVPAASLNVGLVLVVEDAPAVSWNAVLVASALDVAVVHVLEVVHVP